MRVGGVTESSGIQNNYSLLVNHVRYSLTLCHKTHIAHGEDTETGLSPYKSIIFH